MSRQLRCRRLPPGSRDGAPQNSSYTWTPAYAVATPSDQSPNPNRPFALAPSTNLQSPCVMNGEPAQQRLGHDQPDHPFLATLQQLHQGRADAIVGLLSISPSGGQTFSGCPATGDKPWLLVANLFHQHSLPQTLAEALQTLDLPQFDPRATFAIISAV